jgi:hypothetical protein
MLEPSYDPSNQFSIPMLADQHVRLRSPIPQRGHELLRVPEGKNDVLASAVELVHLFAALRANPHAPPEQPDQSGANRRQHAQFQPIQHLVNRESLFVNRTSLVGQAPYSFHG